MEQEKDQFVLSRRSDDGSNDPDAGRPQATKTYKHYCKKDGLYYKSYRLMVEANKRANEKKLKELGLDDSKLKQPKKKTSMPSKNAASSNHNAEPTRRSKRIRKEPVPYSDEPLYAFDDPSVLTTPKKKPRTSNHMAARPVTPEAVSVSEQDRTKIKKIYAARDNKTTISSPLPLWLQDMEEYLIHQEGLSRQNYRTVMRQVEKMCTGAGITYHRWEPGVYFAKGQAIDLSWDMEVLYNQACELEDTYGRDLGNGWLMRHPIKKMNNFQRYLLEQQEQQHEKE